MSTGHRRRVRLFKDNIGQLEKLWAVHLLSSIIRKRHEKLKLPCQCRVHIRAAFAITPSK